MRSMGDRYIEVLEGQGAGRPPRALRGPAPSGGRLTSTGAPRGPSPGPLAECSAARPEPCASWTGPRSSGGVACTPIFQLDLAQFACLRLGRRRRAPAVSALGRRRRRLGEGVSAGREATRRIAGSSGAPRSTPLCSAPRLWPSGRTRYRSGSALDGIVQKFLVLLLFPFADI